MIDDQTVQNVKNVYEALNEAEAFRSDFEVEDVVGVLADIQESQSRSVETHSDQTEREVGTSYLAVAAIGAICRALGNSDSPNLLGENWLEPELDIDPNQLFEGLLVSITNHTLASVEVLKRGLADSGSILMRSVYEITSLALVLAYFRKDMISYATTIDGDEQLKLFKTDLSIENIGKKVNELETQIGLPEDASSGLSAHRQEAYSMFSKSVHGQFPVALTGKWAPGLDNEVELSIFGSPSIASRNNLYYLNLQIFYFVNILLISAGEKHQFNGGGSKLWEIADTLIKTHAACFRVIDEPQIGD